NSNLTGNSNSDTVGVFLGDDGSSTGQTYTIIDHNTLVASIAAVAPDPRLTSLGVIAINFSEAVQNVDISDFVLTCDGNAVPLNPSMLTGNGSQYSIDLGAVTTSAGNPVLGNYVLTLNASDIKSLAGIPLASGATGSWQIIAT